MSDVDRLRGQNEQFIQLIESIKSALGTAEDGSSLIEVARNAHMAEMELAALERRREESRP